MPSVGFDSVGRGRGGGIDPFSGSDGIGWGDGFSVGLSFLGSSYVVGR